MKTKDWMRARVDRLSQTIRHEMRRAINEGRPVADAFNALAVTNLLSTITHEQAVALLTPSGEAGKGGEV